MIAINPSCESFKDSPWQELPGHFGSCLFFYVGHGSFSSEYDIERFDLCPLDNPTLRRVFPLLLLLLTFHREEGTEFFSFRGIEPEAFGKIGMSE